MKKLALLFAFLPLFASARFTLSPTAEIRVVTCGPYQGELYSAFGHSAVRVYDPIQGIDLIYNYGVFDFNQPDFYLNFTRGHLLYRLAVQDYQNFFAEYLYENRYVHEQILNLSKEQKQAYFDFLQVNSLPENREYLYDYFYDNCATRIRDGLKEVMGNQLRFDGSYITTDHSIRDLCDIYLEQQPWGDLGIDLCLGLPMDKKATPEMYMFLPDYIEKGFNNAYIAAEGGEKPLVLKTIVTNKVAEQPTDDSLFTPFVVMMILLLFGMWLTYRGIKKGRRHRWFDIVLFSFSGLIGWFLLLLWVATDHQAAANNFNLLWALPLNFPVALWLVKSKLAFWVKRYFCIVTVILALTLLTWAFLPQDLHYSLIPLAVLLLMRGFFLQRQNNIAP